MWSVCTCLENERQIDKRISLYELQRNINIHGKGKWSNRSQRMLFFLFNIVSRISTIYCSLKKWSISSLYHFLSLQHFLNNQLRQFHYLPVMVNQIQIWQSSTSWNCPNLRKLSIVWNSFEKDNKELLHKTKAHCELIKISSCRLKKEIPNTWNVSNIPNSFNSVRSHSFTP